MKTIDEVVTSRERGSGAEHAVKMLHLTCFGGFRIAGAHGWERGPEQKRARELMQYLGLHPKGISPRARLTEILWPGQSADALHRLHSAVSDARRFLRGLLDGFDAIRCSNEGYSWHPAVHVVSDVGMFLEHYRDGSPAALRDAVALYGGALLEGQDGDWLEPSRVKYAFMYTSMVERLADEAFAQGDYDGALHFGLELLAADRANEGASRLVMRCFGALGRRSQAASEYAALSTSLRKHLGIDPMPETTELFRAIMGR